MQKIGVFVCWCGSNIAATVDVDAVVEAIKRNPALFMPPIINICVPRAARSMIRKAIKEYRLDGIVICSCSPRMHEATFRKAAAAAGLNPYMVEIANIREHCSWIHKDRAEATEKAIILARDGNCKV